MDQVLKCVFLGDSSCGKTKLISAFVNDEFDEDYEPTISETYNKVFTFGGKTIRLDIVDMSSAREYEVFRSKMYPKTDVFVFCYDVTSPSTASSVHELWFPEVEGTTPNPHYIVVGCKADLKENKEALKNAKNAAKSLRCEMITCSAKTKKNVKHVFEEIIKSANSGSCVIM